MYTVNSTIALVFRKCLPNVHKPRKEYRIRISESIGNYQTSLGWMSDRRSQSIFFHIFLRPFTKTYFQNVGCGNSYRAQNIRQTKSRFVGFPRVFVCVFGFCWGFKLFPDGLQYVSAHFWNFEKCNQIWTPAPYLLQKSFNEYKKQVGTFYKI